MKYLNLSYEYLIRNETMVTEEEERDIGVTMNTSLEPSFQREKNDGGNDKHVFPSQREEFNVVQEHGKIKS